jgi:hypothetical protein
MDVVTKLSRVEANAVANKWGPRSQDEVTGKMYPTWTVNHCQGFTPFGLAKSIIPGDTKGFFAAVEKLAHEIATVAGRGVVKG